MIFEILRVQGQATNKAISDLAPTTTAKLSKFGDAAASISVVGKTAEISAAGLQEICTAGNVYCLDNSAGTGPAYAYFDGPP